MKSITRRTFIKALLIAFVVLAFVDSFWFEKYVIDWNFFDISKGTRRKIKLIQLSDLHIDKVRSFHKSIAARINTLNPDLICFTGDALDKRNNIGVLDEFLALLDVNIPKFAILGNWEYWGNVDISELTTIYKKHNCQLLINDSRPFSAHGRTISIIGLDDLVGGNPDIHIATSQLAPADRVLVLAHCPEQRDVLEWDEENGSVELILSGHTHGGQINVFGWVPFKPRGSGSYLKGWYLEDGPQMYVSRGIGTTILPFRFGARAEVMELDI